MKTKTVLFIDMPLWINGIRKTSEGKIKSGYVINGDWTLNIDYDKMECIAKEHDNVIRNRWSFKETDIVEVDVKSTCYDYNLVVNKAIEERGV